MVGPVDQSGEYRKERNTFIQFYRIPLVWIQSVRIAFSLVLSLISLRDPGKSTARVGWDNLKAPAVFKAHDMVLQR